MEEIEKPMISVWPDEEQACRHDPMLAECFRDAGYDTALLGKWHLSRIGGGALCDDIFRSYRISKRSKRNILAQIR